MSNSLKRERANSTANDASTAEYDEWAKKLVNRPVPQSGVQPLNQLGLGQVQVVADGVPANEGYDIDSAIGRFSWETIATGKHVPTLYRNGQQFCSIRMLETSVLDQLLQVTPQEIYDSAKLTSYFITNAEAKLLTYVNTWHCDSQYGPRHFTSQDLIVTLEESKKLYEFILFAYNVLSSGGKNKDDDYSKCGFVRVNNDSLIPYTVLKDDEKSVPLFYFEGQTDILKEKAEPLSGWELSYLKICCKVQGVRKDLISGDTLQVVKLTDLRSYFPKRSTFEEECWPPPKTKSLLPKQHSISSMTSLTSNTSVGGIYNNSLSITSNTPKIPNRVVSNDNFQNRSTAGARPTNNNNNTNRAISTGNSGFTSASQTLSTSNLVRTNGNGPSTAINNVRTTNFNANANNNRNGSTNNSTNNGVMTTMSNGIVIQLAKNAPPARKSTMDLTKLRLPSPPADYAKLNYIPEYTDSRKDGAYSVRTISIENGVNLHCINCKPFNADGYLIILQELMNRYFPTVTIYPTAITVLSSIGIGAFLPNCYQIAALNKYGFVISRAWEIPLVSATEVVGMLPRIKLLLTPKPTPTRMSNNPIGNNSPQSTNNNNSFKNKSLFYTNSSLGHAR